MYVTPLINNGKMRHDIRNLADAKAVDWILSVTYETLVNVDQNVQVTLSIINYTTG